MKRFFHRLNSPVLVLSFLVTHSVFAQTTRVQQMTKRPIPKSSPTKMNTPQLETPNLLKQSTPEAAKLTQRLTNGVGNGGGGATVQNRPIERYAKLPSKIKGWSITNSNKISVEVVLQKLDQKFPLYSRHLRDLARNATWYLIPRELVKIPDNYQGLPFNSDQSIINLNNEIFIDSRKWEGKDSEDAGTLLFHELVMLSLKEALSGPTLHSTTRKLGSHIIEYIDNTSADQLENDFYNKGYPTKMAQYLRTKNSLVQEKEFLEQSGIIKNQHRDEFKRYIQPICAMQILPLTLQEISNMNITEAQAYAEQILSVTGWISQLYVRAIPQSEVVRICGFPDSCNANEAWNNRFKTDLEIKSVALFLEELGQYGSVLVSGNIVTGISEGSTAYVRTDYSIKTLLNNLLNSNEKKPFDQKFNQTLALFSSSVTFKDSFYTHLGTGYKHNTLVPFMKNICDWSTQP